MTHRLKFNVKNLNEGKDITKLQNMLTRKRQKSRNIHLYEVVHDMYRQRIQMEFGVSRKHEIIF